MLVIERFYNPVILVSLSSYQTPVTVGGICERRATCRGEKAATSLKKKAEFLQSLLECRFATASSSGASFLAWQRRARNEWLVMNRKGPWEGRRRQAKRRLATSRLLSPSRLPLRAHFHQKRDVWVRGRFREETSGGVSRCRQGFLRLGCKRSWKVLRSTEKDIFTKCKFKLTMMGSHTF